MKQTKTASNPKEEEPFIASECISDSTGTWYICSVCGKRHKNDLEAMLCCL